MDQKLLEAINSYERDIARTTELINLLKKMDGTKLAKYDRTRLADSIILAISFDQLSSVRSDLREFFGSWEDHLDRIAVISAHELLAFYTSKKNLLIKIWISIDPDNIPDEYTHGGTCKLKKITREDVVFVCDGEFKKGKTA